MSPRLTFTQTNVNVASSDTLTFIKDKLYYATMSSAPTPRPDTHYFTIDHVLVYQHFYADFGPLNLAQLLRFCDTLKKLLRQPELTSKKIVLYSSAAPDKRANALFLMCGFMMLVCEWTPEQACQPIASVADTIVPFRDAGYGPDTYHISIFDCLKGLKKAMQCKLITLDDFDLEEYEYYEKVDHGDMNWLMKNKFLAFATPHDDLVPLADPNAYPKTVPRTKNENLLPHGIPWRLNDYINYFKKNKVTTVIRLNHKVYDRQRFVEQGLEHIELYFHDGSCPSMEILNAFLEIVESNRRVAVHCKAGLGRTGSLIAAYIMKHYHFTASEIIGYMRIVRPGSVVGPQQNWLAAMQDTLWAMGSAVPAVPSPALSLALGVTSRLARTATALVSSVKAASLDKNYVLQPHQPLSTPLLAAKVAAVSQQDYIKESAVPATQTTFVGDQIVAIPMQPRKGSDGGLTPSSSFLAAVEQLLVDTDSTSASNAVFNGSDTSHAKRYNLRASTVAARSTPGSRSNSQTFDAFTPRSTSNASLKMKVASTRASPLAGSSRRKDLNPLLVLS